MPGSARLIVASDIFGRTPHLEGLADALGAAVPGGAAIVDPYGGEPRTLANTFANTFANRFANRFADEAEAHAAFLASGGLPAYAARLADELRRAGPGATLLGFSAGGAAVWLAACDPSLPLPCLAVCLYAGQVRHHADLVPRCPCRLVFPVHEDHFDVAALAARLDGVPGVTAETAPFLHGFMNPLSKNFDAAGCREWTRRLAGLLAAPD